MRTGNLSYRLVAVFTFGVGVAAFLFWSGLSGRERNRAKSEPIVVLTPARAVDPYGEASEGPDTWMIIDRPSISRPVNLYVGDEDLLEFNCATIIISIDDDRLVSLNGEAVGTLENMREVAAKLKGFFTNRAGMGVFSRDKMSRGDLLDFERAYKTVLIKPSPSLTFDEVARVIGAIKKAGAKPIAIYTRYLEPQALRHG